MDLKFSEYNWEQLLEEDSFISWILRNENSREWEKMVKKNSQFGREVEKAKRIILLLQDKHENLDEASVKSMWAKIESFDREARQTERKISIQRTFGWAASVLLIVSLGVLAFYYFRGNMAEYEFAATNLRDTQESHMLLPTGETIVLAGKNNKIKLEKNGQQLIVNDSLISLEEPVFSGKRDEAMNELVIPYGRQSELMLADGTVIWLNAGSKLAFPAAFAENRRVVHLEGEACFQVAEDENRPFIVRTGAVYVEVLGTFFNVSAYPDQETIETVLISGSVALNKRGTFSTTSVELIPNEKGVFDKSENDFSVSAEPNAVQYVAWVNGWLEYRRESLNSVLVKLERYYDVKFRLPSNFPADDKISGKLDLNTSLENIMMVLSDAAQIDYKIVGKEVYISRKGNG